MAYETAVGAATQTEILALAGAYAAQGNSDASAWDAYIHAIDAASAAEEESDAEADEVEMLAIDSAEQTQMLADTGAETAYQIQLDSFAETQAIAGASAQDTLTTSLGTALAVQATSDAVAQDEAAHTMNQLTKQYQLEMGDAYTTYTLAGYDADTQDLIATDMAAASAWSQWGSSGGTPSAVYTAAMNAASYTYLAAQVAANGSALDVSVTADNQWAHDVSDGWLTYKNTLADDAQTDSNATATAATTLVNSLATDELTFATTVAPAIQAAADAQNNDANQAVQSLAPAAQSDASTKAAAALADTSSQISALQACGDALGDDARQEATQADAAGPVLAGIAADEIGVLVAAAPAAQMTKNDFTADLQKFVAEAKIGGRPNTYVADANSPFPENQKPGFDCDDFVFATINFLSTTELTKDPNVIMWMLSVTYTKTDGTNNGHQFLVVQRGSEYWLVNATRGVVLGRFTSIDDLKDEATRTHVRDYSVDESKLIIYTISYSREEYQKTFPNEPQPWYTNEEMRLKMLEIFRKVGVDPYRYYPQSMQPAPPPPLPPGPPFESWRFRQPQP